MRLIDAALAAGSLRLERLPDLASLDLASLLRPSCSMLPRLRASETLPVREREPLRVQWPGLSQMELVVLPVLLFAARVVSSGLPPVLQSEIGRASCRE